MEDIFAKLKAHILEGMVFHDEMSRYFDFLNLNKYRINHIFHYEEETKTYRKVCEYYMHHANKLIPTYPMNRPDVIPESWYNYTRKDVDTSTKKNAVRNAIRKWVEWEADTKNLYEEMCGELLNEGYIAEYEFLSCIVRDVNEELKDAMDQHIYLESIGYDLSVIQ